jgi:hypothetical protein
LISSKEEWFGASSSLNIVLDFDPNVKNFLAEQNRNVFSNNSWLVIFPSILNSSLTQTIETEFSSLEGICLNSLFYVLAIKSNDNFKIFELFRTRESGDLIASEVWRFDASGWKEIDSRFIWKRRKDLTGTHFKVAVKLNTSLITQRDGVS